MTPMEEAIRNTLALNLRTYRKENKFTQNDLCEILKITRTTYTKWETATSIPNIFQLEKLSTLYNVPVDKFFHSTEPFRLRTNDVYGDQYLSELSDEERLLIGKYRLLKKDDRNKVDNYLKKIIDD